MMSQWVSDIATDTKQSCDKQLGSFSQDLGKSGSLKQDTRSRWWENTDVLLKITLSSHISIKG